MVILDRSIDVSFMFNSYLVELPVAAATKSWVEHITCPITVSLGHFVHYWFQFTHVFGVGSLLAEVPVHLNGSKALCCCVLIGSSCGYSFNSSGNPFVSFSVNCIGMKACGEMNPHLLRGFDACITQLGCYYWRSKDGISRKMVGSTQYHCILCVSSFSSFLFLPFHLCVSCAWNILFPAWLFFIGFSVFVISPDSTCLIEILLCLADETWYLPGNYLLFSMWITGYGVLIDWDFWTC